MLCRARLLARQDAVGLVEDDDRLAALLDQGASTRRVGVHRSRVLSDACGAAFVATHSVTTRSPVGNHPAPPARARPATIVSPDGEGLDHRGRRRDRPRDGAPSRDRGLRRRRRRERRDRARAAALRAAGRLRARPDASRDRRLARDRAGALGGDRDADRRRLGARHRARPRPRARDRRRRLPREAVLAQGADGARPGGRPARGQQRRAAPRGRDRDRGASARPRQRPGVRRRRAAPS